MSRSRPTDPATHADVPLLRSLVAGAWRDGERSAPDLDPAHPGETVARVALASSGLVVEAVGAARDAQAAWRATPAPSRGEILRLAADLLEQRLDAVARDLTREEGKTLAESVGETRRAVGVLRYFAAQTLEPDGDTFASHSASTFLYARREPVGVVAVVTPWNFPIAIPAVKIAPALAYGNTVVWKPATLVPLTATHLARALVDAGLPAGVLNLILGTSSDVGDALVAHQDVDAISFTGSNEVGRALQRRAVEHGARVQLELGGKNPAIVLADADLAQAAEQIARGAFLSAGQKCTATSRVIVEEAVLGELTERLVALAEEWTVGDPLDPATKVGPLVSAERLDAVLGHIATARDDGARVVAGGARLADSDGYYVRPTVLDGVSAGSGVLRDEIFGPVAALLPASSFEDAIALANDTRFGLSASLFTRDLERALRFTREIRAGVVKVNQESAGYELHAPSGGMKDSGSGSREYGKAAREFYTDWKTVYLDLPPARASATPPRTG